VAFKPYPNELVEANWKNHRGIIAKLATNESGISEKLRLCFVSYDKTVRHLGQEFDRIMASSRKDVDRADAIIAELRDDHLPQLDRALKELATLAGEKADAWGKKTSPVPHGTTQYVRTMKQKAEEFRRDVAGDLRDMIAEFNRMATGGG